MTTMAERLERHDWASTPLGPRESWPAALRIAVGICMDSRFPMFVWWGPQLINIYNDAYIPVLGEKHPQAFGLPARDSWEEIWDVVGQQAEQVMVRGEATWNERVLLVMERHGYREDTWFTWSYSPIRDETGTVVGLFCACYEDTPAVLAERERDRLLGEVMSERQRLVTAFENSPSFLALLEGPDHVFRFANERYFQLISRNDILGRPVREALQEVAGQGFFEILDNVYRTGEAFVGNDIAVELRDEAGKPVVRHVDFVYQPMTGADGVVQGILVVGNDVTARHGAEARDQFLLSLEDALRPLTDPVEISACAARLLGDYLRVDRCAYAEVSEDEQSFEVIGNYHPNLHSIVGHYAMLDFGVEWTRCMQEGVPYVVDDVDTHQPPLDDVKGAYRATGIQAVVAVPLRKGGKLVGAMAVHQKTARQWGPRDIEALTHVASRVYESMQRGRVEKTLRESEAQFRQLADAMPQIVFSATPDGHVDYFNRQWYEYTGLKEGEAGIESWRKVHTPEGLARVMQAWPESLRTGQVYEIEYPLRRHDGELRWHLGRAQPIRDATGKIVRWFGTNTDIHDRKRIEEALAQALQNEQQARAQAETASRMKDEFLATLSHELRTPLNAILGWSSMLRRPEATPQQLAQGAEVIERNARSQARIIEDLLDMSAIISGKVRLEVDTLDLPGLVRSGIETARPTADAKGVALEVDIDALPGVLVRGDAHRLTQVLWNLLTNAIKFTGRGGKVQVSLRHADEAHVELQVTDTGEGIAPEFLPFVFDRFRQADASTTRRHGGLGLGLSIVKQLVELHGGKVAVASAGPGRGATFIVRLPSVPVALPEMARRERRAQPPVTEVFPSAECERIRGLRVLVVDDDPDARELVCRLLETCGAAVRTAASTDEAILALQGGAFDVLVSDIGMPGEDGYALMRRVRAMDPERNGDIPAVALTAYARGEDRIKAIRAGFHVHAAKPLDPAELIAAVANLGGLRSR